MMRRRRRQAGMEDPSENKKREMYQFYTQIYDSSFDKQKKKNLLTSIAGWEKWSWRVVGITANAVGRIIEKKGHASVKKELVRDHFFQSRSKTYENMLKKKLNFDDYWKEFWENDRTILMTKEEHNLPNWKMNVVYGANGNILDLDWRYGYFTSNKVAGFHFTYKKEGDFIFFNFKDKVEKKIDKSKSTINNTVYYYDKK